METKEARAKLFAKMTGVMSEMDRIEKRGHNNYFNYDFVTSDDVLSAVRKAMVKHGLALFVNILSVETIPTGSVDKGGNSKIKHVVDFEFSICDTETGEILPVIWKGEALDGEDKAISKCATSAEKYFLLKTFLISTGDEPDPDESDENGKRDATKRQPVKTAPAQTKQPTPPPDPEDNRGIPAELMHLMGVCTSDGVPYPLLSSETLSGHSIGIAKVLAKNGLTPEKKHEYEVKQQAISEILAYRNK